MAVTSSYVVRHVDDPNPFATMPPDLWFPRYATIEVEDEERVAGDLTIKVVFDSEAGRYIADSIHVLRRGPRAEINSAALRTIPVQEYMRTLGYAVRIGSADEDAERMPPSLSPDQADEIKKLGPSNDEALTWVARIYRVAFALNHPPNKAVQDELRMPAPTASVWIRRARDRKILNDDFEWSDAKMSEAEFKRARRVLED